MQQGFVLQRKAVANTLLTVTVYDWLASGTGCVEKMSTKNVNEYMWLLPICLKFNLCALMLVKTNPCIQSHSTTMMQVAAGQRLQFAMVDYSSLVPFQHAVTVCQITCHICWWQMRIVRVVHSFSLWICLEARPCQSLNMPALQCSDLYLPWVFACSRAGNDSVP